MSLQRRRGSPPPAPKEETKRAECPSLQLKPKEPEVAVNQSIDVEKIKADLKAELKREAEEAKRSKAERKPKKKVVIQEESESEEEEEGVVVVKKSP